MMIPDLLTVTPLKIQNIDSLPISSLPFPSNAKFFNHSLQFLLIPDFLLIHLPCFLVDMFAGKKVEITILLQKLFKIREKPPNFHKNCQKMAHSFYFEFNLLPFYLKK